MLIKVAPANYYKGTEKLAILIIVKTFLRKWAKVSNSAIKNEVNNPFKQSLLLPKIYLKRCCKEDRTHDILFEIRFVFKHYCGFTDIPLSTRISVFYF
jgi:hypothetical protein